MTPVLSYGKHRPGDRACVVEAARLAVGEPWGDLIGDDPASCIGPACAAYARSLNDAYGDGDDADARRTAALSPLIALLSGTRAIECAMRWVWVDLALASAAEAVESYGGDASALRACIPVQDAEAAARAARAAEADEAAAAWAAEAAAEAAEAAWAAESDRYASLGRAASRFIAALERLHAEHSEVPR